MIIDIHNHILPGVDDGAKDMEETKEMIKIAVEEGIGAIVATPHYEVGMGAEILAKYQRAYSEVSDYIEKHQIPLELYQGNEIFYSESITETLQENGVYGINGTRYVLVEFSIDTGYHTIERALNNLLYAGYRPILAHTERYIELHNLKKIAELVRLGTRVQINANSVLGKEGWRMKRFCLQLMKNHLVHVVGTDAHGSSRRRPVIKECAEYIEKKLGRSYCKLICEKNPQKILEGEKISGKDRVD